MTSEELWNQLVAKQPVFGGDPSEHITQTKRGLKRLFEMAFTQGFWHAVNTASARKALLDQVEKHGYSMENLRDK